MNNTMCNYVFHLSSENVKLLVPVNLIIDYNH